MIFSLGVVGHVCRREASKTDSRGAETSEPFTPGVGIVMEIGTDVAALRDRLR